MQDIFFLAEFLTLGLLSLVTVYKMIYIVCLLSDADFACFLTSVLVTEVHLTYWNMISYSEH